MADDFNGNAFLNNSSKRKISTALKGGSA